MDCIEYILERLRGTDRDRVGSVSLSDAKTFRSVKSCAIDQLGQFRRQSQDRIEFSAIDGQGGCWNVGGDAEFRRRLAGTDIGDAQYPWQSIGIIDPQRSIGLQ